MDSLDIMIKDIFLPLQRKTTIMHQDTRRLIASVNGWKINLMVCYDLRSRFGQGNSFDEERNFEYDVLIYVANWPERRIPAWKTLLQARAIENQCYVIGVNRVGEDGNGIYHSGDSMVIDPLGNILYQKTTKKTCLPSAWKKNLLKRSEENFLSGKIPMNLRYRPLFKKI